MSGTYRGALWALLLSCTFSITSWAQDDAGTQNDEAEANPFASLEWQIGPKKVAVGTNAMLDVPEGYVFLDAKNTARFMQLTENFSSGQEYLVAPADNGWFAVLEFDEMGYVKDDEKIDAPALLQSVRDATEAGNTERRSRGWSEMHVTGWRFEPRYDSATQRLEWAIDAKSGGETVTNFNTRILGRHGVTSVALVEDPTELDAAVSQFKTVIAGYTFNDGHRYAEYVPGDKVATYGLAALIAGGTAAAAAKSGLLKGLWKFLVVGGVALLGGLRVLLGRKKQNA